jgi:hypothetical protein
MIAGLDVLAAVEGSLAPLDIIILVAYFAVLIGLGVYTSRKIVSSEEFMIAGRKIPGWAAGLSVMCAYTSSLSYIATPGKSFGSNWNPVLFAYSMVPSSSHTTEKSESFQYMSSSKEDSGHGVEYMPVFRSCST